jgi:hypothetical protein
MIANCRRGTLLATTSAAAFTAYPAFPMYIASKAAANGLVRAAALEFGKYGIRATGLAPTHGMSVNFALPADSEVLGMSYEEVSPWHPDNRAMLLRLDRPPTIRDNANVALFLASDEAAYMSRHTLHGADGGEFCRTSAIAPTDVGDNRTLSSANDGPVVIREPPTPARAASANSQSRPARTWPARPFPRIHGWLRPGRDVGQHNNHRHFS